MKSLPLVGVIAAAIPVALIAVVIVFLLNVVGSVRGNPLIAFPLDPGSFRQGLTFETTNGGNEVLERYFDGHTLASVKSYYAHALNHDGWVLKTKNLAADQWTFRRAAQDQEQGTLTLDPLQVGVIVRITYIY